MCVNSVRVCLDVLPRGFVGLYYPRNLGGAYHLTFDEFTARLLRIPREDEKKSDDLLIAAIPSTTIRSICGSRAPLGRIKRKRRKKRNRNRRIFKEAERQIKN